MSRFQSNERTSFWPLWLKVCRRHGWENTDDRRHALYFRALGYPKRQKDFGHAEWDAVYKELRLNLAGFISEGPERRNDVQAEGERRRLVYKIRQCAPDAYIKAVADDKFGFHADWRNLEIPQLEALRLTVIERMRAKDRAAKIEAKQHKIDFDKPNQPAARQPAGYPESEYEF